MSATFPLRLRTAVTRAGNAVGDELLPVLVWLTVFGVTRVAPSLILRLAIAVPQSMDVPPLLQWRRQRRASSARGFTADELSARLADLINETPSGASSSSHGATANYGAAAALLPDASSWTRGSHRLSESLFSLFTYPQRLLTYALFQYHQRPALRADDAAQRSRPVVVKMLLRLVTSFTATWVHASGNMLYDTIVTYFSTRLGSWSNGGTAGFVLGGGGPGGNASSSRLSSGWRDVLVATCVSTSVNFFLQTFWLQAMTNVGELRALGRRPASSRSDDDPTSSFTHVVLSTLSRLGSKDTLFRLGRMALQPRPSTLSSSSASPTLPPPPAPTAAPVVSAQSRHPSVAPPARVYLCGGNAFVFALSGFRFAFYSDLQQLTTSAANIVTDVLDLILRQANQRAAAQQYSSGDRTLNGQVWQPPAGLQTAGVATSSDVVLTPASSMQLLPIYLANFAVGAGVGLLWRERSVLLAFGRKVPLVRSVLAVLAPLPPSALRLPEALQELSPECNVLMLHVNGRLEVVGEERAAPIVKREPVVSAALPPPLAAAGAVVHQEENVASAVRARIVVAQDLFCPIKRTVMCDPVLTEDGFTYDRDGIEEWLRVHDTAPLTNLHLGSVAVRVNWEARRRIEELIAQCAAALDAPIARAP